MAEERPPPKLPQITLPGTAGAASASNRSTGEPSEIPGLPQLKVPRRYTSSAAGASQVLNSTSPDEPETDNVDPQLQEILYPLFGYFKIIPQFEYQVRWLYNSALYENSGGISDLIRALEEHSEKNTEPARSYEETRLYSELMAVHDKITQLQKSRALEKRFGRPEGKYD